MNRVRDLKCLFVTIYLFTASGLCLPTDGLAKTMTIQEFEEDLSYFKNCLEYGYSGFEFLTKNIKTDIMNKIETIKQSYHKNITLDEFRYLLKDCLSVIPDRHIFFYDGPTYKDHFDFYIATLNPDNSIVLPLIENSNNLNDELKSQNVQVPNIFRSIIDGKSTYIVGKLAKHSISPILDNETYKYYISAQLCDPDIYNKTEMKYQIMNESVYFRPGSLNDVYANMDVHKLMQTIESVATVGRSKKNVIIDLRYSRGGNNTFLILLIKKLYDLSEKSFESAGYYDLVSPITIKGWENTYANYQSSNELIAQYMAIWEKRRFINRNKMDYLWKMWDIKETHEFNPQVGSKSFTGRLIFITSRYTLSAAESIIKIMKHFDNVLQIGENTAGASSTGNIFHYQLINSGFDLYLPSSIMIDSRPPIIEDGYGLVPDVWCYSIEHLRSVLLYFTGDAKIKALID